MELLFDAEGTSAKNVTQLHRLGWPSTAPGRAAALRAIFVGGMAARHYIGALGAPPKARGRVYGLAKVVGARPLPLRSECGMSLLRRHIPVANLETPDEASQRRYRRCH